jgi:ATP-binding cassette subfamily G (WHITE) protein 2 (SNQ2)
MFSEKAEGREGTRVPLHNTQQNHQETSSASSSGAEVNRDGTFGERDIGGPVNFRNAMLEYEELRTELSNLSRTRSGKTDKSNQRRLSSGLRRVTTTGTDRSRRKSNATGPEPDLEAQGDEKPGDPEEGDFELGEFLKDGHFEKREEGRSAKKVGVVYKHLTVKGCFFQEN